MLAGVALGLLWPVVLGYSRAESGRLSDEGARVGGAEGEVDYHLAYWLDHGNAAAALHFATAQLAADQPDAALTTLEQAGKGSEVVRVRIEAGLELGDIAQSVQVAHSLTDANPNEADIMTAALAFGVAGEGSALQALEARVSSPEALQRVKRAEAGNLPLASELYATGLLRSSSALLVKLPASKLRSLYLGRINYRWHTKATLATAADYYASTISLDPTDQQARREYIVVLQDLGRSDEVATQQQLLAKLVSGTP